MSAQGLCSRREADTLIKNSWVNVAGYRKPALGEKFSPHIKIHISPEGQKHLSKKLSILINKPLGYVSGQAEEGKTPVTELIKPAYFYGQSEPAYFPHWHGFAPAGRLDINSTGLLILTQDGVLAKKLISKNSKIQKEYLVRIGTKEAPVRVSQKQLTSLEYGLELDGKKLKPAKVHKVGEHQIKITLTEGRKHQIRRMCDLVGLRVFALKRVRIGKLRLGRLPLGNWRFIKAHELGE